MTIHRFAFPTDIHFGPGARREAAAYLVAQGCKRPLIVTDKGIAALPLLGEFKSTLQGLAVEVFAGVAGNPLTSQVDAGVAAFKKHGADAVIGLGGGAALDVAKAVALMAVHPGSVLEYAWDHPQVRPIEHELPCFIALPTTAGTGSEVGRSSVISDDTTHIKKIIFSVKLLATAVFADPELTLDLPPNVTAATGMDALTHNVESYIAKGYHPICDGIALEGVRIAARALPIAVCEPRNLQARADMLMASMMGAVAFQKDLGATHSCAHALSTVADLHHGLANGIMIDYVMRFNQAVEVERFALMAQAVGVAQNSAAASADAFVAWLTALKREVGIPAKLGAVKVTRQHLPKLLDVAVDDICHKTNPRPCTREDFERIFTEAI
ncbi:MAG TPA: iron-containing alcohol dehydrogenase [Burkholderiales bacterium]|nr:iron-containing alcohol dehydrogenase [Burkholderiales bacterium]